MYFSNGIYFHFCIENKGNEVVKNNIKSVIPDIFHIIILYLRILIVS